MNVGEDVISSPQGLKPNCSDNATNEATVVGVKGSSDVNSIASTGDIESDSEVRVGMKHGEGKASSDDKPIVTSGFTIACLTDDRDNFILDGTGSGVEVAPKKTNTNENTVSPPD